MLLYLLIHSAIVYTPKYIQESTIMMTRVFKSGNSQAVRIPKEFQLDVAEIEIIQRGEELILRKKQNNLSDVLDLFATLPDDFMQEGRTDPAPQERYFEQ